MTSSIRYEYGDEDVKRRIDSFLATKHFPEFRNLIVTVDQGAVTVSGCVDTFYAKQVALHSCQRVAGVNELIDSILVSLDSQELIANA